MPARLTAFRTRELGALRVIGKELRWSPPSGTPNPIPEFWRRSFEDGTIALLQQHGDLIEPNVLTGWMGRYDPRDQSFAYMVSVLARPGATVPNGCVSVDVAAKKYAVGTMEGTEPDIYMSVREATLERMARDGLENDMAFGSEFEWYDERFMANPEVRVIDYLVPIK